MIARTWIAAGLLVATGAANAEQVTAVDAFARTEAALSIAASLDGRVVVGDPRGAWAANGSGIARRVATGAAVHGVAFAHDGALWLGTEDGLRRQDPVSLRLVPRGPAPGGASRVRDLVAAGGGVIAATAAGLFHADARTTRALGSAVPRGDATALSWSGDGAWLAAIVDERVVMVRFGPGLVARVSDWLVFPPGAGMPRDLAATASGVLILTDRGVYRSDGTQVVPTAHPFPAGAEPRRIATTRDLVWLATSRGLYRSGPFPSGSSGWQAVGPTGAPIAALAAAGETLFAAGTRGVWRIRIDPAGGAGAPSTRVSDAPLVRVRAQPPIEALHRAVVRAHGLDPARGHRWRKRVAARGRLPEFELRFGYGGGRDLKREYDEAFTSGALRRLNDRDRDRNRDFDVSAVLRWDFGDTLHHPEEIDVAREVREWIELRDEILDEVHQLYFERLRVLAERDALAPRDPARLRLEIRASELSAGLDAWTAGWWSAALRAAETAQSPPSNSPAP